MSNDANTTRAMFLPINSLPAASVGVGYTPITATGGGTGTAATSPIRIAFIQNLTNQLVFFSEDGINDKLVLLPNGVCTIDLTPSRSDRANILAFPQGTILYARHSAVAPNTGSIYVTWTVGAPNP
jgi:hypothetical protein